MRTDDPVEQVRIAYADAYQIDNGYPHDARCLTFLPSRWLSADEAVEAVSCVGQYNAFTPDDTAAMLREVADLDPEARFLVAREGSPAVYVETDDPDGVEDILGPRSYDIEPSDAVAYADSKPDELGTIDVPGSTYSRERFREEGPDAAHWGCQHDEPPVEIDEWPEGDGRPIVRAWWD